jgi:hypothetical protein
MSGNRPPVQSGGAGGTGSARSQLILRERLLAARERVPAGQRARFDAHADRIIELAFHVGIAVALAHIGRPQRDTEDALARAQECAA